MELTKEEVKLVRRLLKGQAPHADFDPYPVCSYFHFFFLRVSILYNNILAINIYDFVLSLMSH